MGTTFKIMNPYKAFEATTKKGNKVVRILVTDDSGNAGEIEVLVNAHNGIMDVISTYEESASLGATPFSDSSLTIEEMRELIEDHDRFLGNEITESTREKREEFIKAMKASGAGYKIWRGTDENGARGIWFETNNLPQLIQEIPAFGE